MKPVILLPVLLFSLATAGEFTIDIPFSASEVELGRMGNFTSVTIPATSSISRVGSPALPVISTPVALPAGTKAAGIEIVNISWQAIRTNCRVLPATKPVPLSLMEEIDIPLPAPDPAIYSSSANFPSVPVKLNESSMLLGFPVAYLSVYPVRWNPATGAVEAISDLEIKVTTEAATDGYSIRTRSAQSEARTRTIVENAVVNPEMVQASGATIVPSRDLTYGEYVVVATPAYQSYAQTFANWKTRKGVPTSVYATTWIQTHYSCVDLQQEIRAFLTDCRDNGVEYVLIWGDDNIIAGRDVQIHYATYTELPPVDLYWSDINDATPGSDLWNSNGNRIWGEWGIDTIDYHPDMFTGRASVNSTAEATTFINKVLAYERVSSTDYFETGPAELRVGYSTGLLWPGCYGSAGAEIITGMVPAGAWEEEKCYESINNNNTATTIAMINAGPAHIYHSSHGSEVDMYTSRGSVYTTADIMAQTNISSGHLPAIWNSIACLIGHLDDYECCGDAWLNSPGGGGFGCFNARYGWGDASNPGYGPSEILVQNLYKAHWTDGQQSLGAMNSMGRDKMNPADDENKDWCVKEYNLFGDPELPLWTADASQLAASYPSSIPGSTAVTVTVTAGGSPVSGARVCLWKGTDWKTAEVYEVKNTNASGVVNIPVFPSSTGEMLLTVWAYNHISYLGSITVNGTGIEEQSGTITSIAAPYPNPAATTAAIPFSLANAGTASIQVFDLSGRTVATPASGNFSAGQHTVNWDITSSDGTPLPSGFYSVVITADNTVMTQRVIVLR
jgi:hypothetical protein